MEELLHVCVIKQVCLFGLQQVVQTQQAHASEISLGVAALETDFTPLFGDATGEGGVGAQLLPQLQHEHTQRALNLN